MCKYQISMPLECTVSELLILKIAVGVSDLSFIEKKMLDESDLG